MNRLAICVLASGPAFCPQATGQSGMISMPAGPEPEYLKPSTAQRLQLAENYGKLPLSFEANIGQADKCVKFFSRGNGYGLYLTDQEAVLALRKGSCPGDEGTRSSVRQPGLSHNDAACRRQTALVRMRLEGSSGATAPEAEERLPGIANRFIGNDPAGWRTRVTTYARVRYRSVYPGVDLVYYGNQRQLEYDFVVAPGGDPKSIRVRFVGAKGLRLSSNGDLVVTVSGGAIAFNKPVIYQLEDGQRKPVAGAFTVLAKHTVGFRLGNYDRAKPLVIDPLLVYSTYLGGASTDVANAIATDAEGNVYVTGSSYSADFPVIQGSLQKTNNALARDCTAFISKLNPTGTALLYSTYIGGTGGGESNALVVYGSGNAYIAGTTFSNDFPVTKGAFQTTDPGGSTTAFVSKLNPTGSALVYSTYLGGSTGGYSRGDRASGLAIDSTGNAYIAGVTYSTDFPVTVGALRTRNNCFFCSNAFVTKLNAIGSALVYSTYLGGTGAGVFSMGPAVFVGDEAAGLSVDSAGHAYITGRAYSRDFPVTEGVFQSTNHAVQRTTTGVALSNPGYNAFVTKLNPTGTAPVYSTYLGGSGYDRASAIVVDGSGNAYITGEADSTDFPVTVKAYKTTKKGKLNAFVSKLNPTGSTLVYSTYLGGTGSDSAAGLAVDGFGHAYITGGTSSADFPVTPGALQTTNRSVAGRNAFFTKLDPAGGALLYSTYLGGSGVDDASGIAVDGAGNAYIAGRTSSNNFPVTPRAFQSTNQSTNNGSNAFVAKVEMGAATATLTVTSTPVGLSFTLPDGRFYTTPYTFAGSTGDALTIAWTTPQLGAKGPNSQLVFAGWSDASLDNPRRVTFQNATVLGHFKQQYLLTVSSQGSGTINKSTGWQFEGEAISLNAKANPCYVFDSWSGSGAGSYSGTNASITINMLGPITETAIFRPVQGPCSASASVVNAASFRSDYLAPGSIFSVFGVGLASATATAPSGAFSRWPDRIGEVQVLLNDKSVPIYYVSPGQINGQIPYDAPIGQAKLVVSVGSQSSAPIGISIAPSGAGIFDIGNNRAAALNQDWSLNTPQTPGAIGSVIAVFMTGQGLVDYAIEAGTPAPQSPLIHSLLPVTATIGGRDAPVEFAGLAVGFVGLLQVNIRIPDSVPAGDQPLTIRIGNSISNAPLISIGVKALTAPSP